MEVIKMVCFLVQQKIIYVHIKATRILEKYQPQIFLLLRADIQIRIRSRRCFCRRSSNSEGAIRLIIPSKNAFDRVSAKKFSAQSRHQLFLYNSQLQLSRYALLLSTMQKHTCLIHQQGRISSSKKEMTMILTFFFVKLFEVNHYNLFAHLNDQNKQNIIWYFTADQFDPNTNYTLTMVVVFVTMVFSCVINNCIFVSLCGFYCRIADEASYLKTFYINLQLQEVGGTFITCLASLSNFGGWWVSTFCLYMLEYVPLKAFALAGWIYCLTYYFVLRRPLWILQGLDKKAYLI